MIAERAVTCYCYAYDESAQRRAERAESWPTQAQDELAQIALEIEASLKGGVYHATADELRAIDEALAAVQRGELATDDEVEAVFAKHRGA